jgi:hypothetical protein
MLSAQSIRIIGVMLFAFGTAALLSGCETVNPWAEEKEEAPSPVAAFVPAQTLANLQLADGRYPNLMGSTSTARWIGMGRSMITIVDADDANPSSAMAEPEFVPGFISFTCNLHSAFPDQSIAYDVVGLRGMRVYLMTPDGRKISPAQIRVGEDLKETSQGALKRFERINTVLFSQKEVSLQVKMQAGMSQTLRLVLDGYNSTFYFEWFPRMPGAAAVESEPDKPKKAG